MDVLVEAYADMLRHRYVSTRVKSDRDRALEQLLPARPSGSIERKDAERKRDPGGARAPAHRWIRWFEPLPAERCIGRVRHLRIKRHRRRIPRALCGQCSCGSTLERLSRTTSSARPSASRGRAGHTTVTLTAGPTGALRDFKNAALGRAGEEWVLDLERQRPHRSGRRDLLTASPGSRAIWAMGWAMTSVRSEWREPAQGRGT